MSDSKMCRNVFPCQQIKNCLSSLYQTPSTAIFASTLFVTKIMCCCVTHDATSSILLNFTNEANTFLTMYNIIRFSRLSKLVSSNLKRSRKAICFYTGVAKHNAQRSIFNSDLALMVYLCVEVDVLSHFHSDYHEIPSPSLIHYIKEYSLC